MYKFCSSIRSCNNHEYNKGGCVWSNKLSYFVIPNISRKMQGMKLIFCADKHQSFLQVDTIIFDGFGQACPKYPDKSAISLHYFKKEVRNEVDFFHAGKH